MLSDNFKFMEQTRVAQLVTHRLAVPEIQAQTPTGNIIMNTFSKA